MFLCVCYFTFQMNLCAQLLSLSGTVVDEGQIPVKDASVRLLNTGLQAITDADGAFFIQGVFAGKYTVEVSAALYATVTKEASVAARENKIHFILSTGSKALDEVIVTAQKKEETLQQTPVSITALTSKKVQDYRLWNIKDVTAIVPNMYLADPGDKRTVTSLRGITTTSYDPAVSTYIDGVNQFSLDTYISPLVDIERIEVLRGPQGTLYGRNAMGGVINIVTKKPTGETAGVAEVSVGNYGQQRYLAAIRTPLIKEKLFAGAAGVFNRLNGFYTNSFTNTNYDQQHSLVGNYYIHYLPSKGWRVTWNAKHNSNRNNGPFPLVFGVDKAFENPFTLSQNATTILVDNIFNTSLSVNYTGRLFNFQSQSAYQSNYRYYTQPIDADFSPLDALTVQNNYGKDWNKVNVVTQEFKLTSSPSAVLPYSWTVGVYLFHQNNPVKQATNFGKDAQMLGAPDTDFSLINTIKTKGFGGAAFGQFTYSLTDKFDVTGGLRYDNEHKEQSVLGQYQKHPAPTPAFDYRSDTAASVTFRAFSPKIGVQYKLAGNSMAFATYARGFRAGGLTPLSSDLSQPALFAFQPEFSTNLEVGTKNKFFRNRLFIHVTAFYTAVSDAQVPTLVLPDAVTITRNTGQLISRGIEAELNATLLNGLQIDYTFGYTNSSFQSLKLSQNGTEVNLNGNRQIFTPDITSFLAAQYRFEISRKHNLSATIRGEWRYLGTQYFDLSNTIRQAPYSLFNTRAGIDIKKWSLFFWGRNMNNKKYIGYAYDFGAVHLGEPKTFGVTLAATF